MSALAGMAVFLFPIPLHAEGSFEDCYAAYKEQKPEAPALCQPFAERGNREAMRLVGDMYYWGWGNLQQNYNEAVLWYKRAAIKGDTVAKYNLGVVFEQGLGVSIDYNRAAKWYLSAAKDGHPMAQYNIGNVFSKGQGVRLNLVEANSWYERAANQGIVDAQYNIANHYALGLGTSKNFVEAYKWYALAEKAGDTDASENMQLLKGAMTPEQIAEAENLAVAWKPKHEWQGME